MIDLEKYRTELDNIHKTHKFTLSLAQIGECIQALKEAKEIMEFYLKWSLTEVETAEKSEQWLSKYFPKEK